jgi:hypothetical protein
MNSVTQKSLSFPWPREYVKICGWKRPMICISYEGGNFGPLSNYHISWRYDSDEDFHWSCSKDLISSESQPIKQRSFSQDYFEDLVNHYVPLPLRSDCGELLVESCLDVRIKMLRSLEGYCQPSDALVSCIDD